MREYLYMLALPLSAIKKGSGFSSFAAAQLAVRCPQGDSKSDSTCADPSVKRANGAVAYLGGHVLAHAVPKFARLKNYRSDEVIL